MSPTHDPRPIPPEKPLPSDCCGGGCAVCVNDAYEEELADYRARLAAWRARHPDGDAGGPG
ncbi:MAG TPA: oxidoreductase-like domain-containing protein [Lysobacter sp.]